jgi:surfeit locus 1 family protein
VNRTGRAVTATLALLSFGVFLGLGTWQVERRSWKLQLIARVEQRVRAPVVAAPGPAEWSTVTAAGAEYRHVSVAGRFLNEASTPVQALTALGAGYWIVTPLRLADDSLVLVNRGFLAGDRRPAVGTVAGPHTLVTVKGLLRMPEPRGGFLRRNDPAADRWYSRDVAAIATARGLERVAPYFIDADRSVSPSDAAAAPVGGLTVIAFANNHLIYALTWYTLALMVPAALWVARRRET